MLGLKEKEEAIINGLILYAVFLFIICLHHFDKALE